MASSYWFQPGKYFLLYSRSHLYLQENWLLAARVVEAFPDFFVSQFRRQALDLSYSYRLLCVQELILDFAISISSTVESPLTC
jgi:hypothetical protein